MPAVVVEQHIESSIEDVWDFLRRPESWPGLVTAIKRVDRSRFDGTVAATEWEVEVGRGVLWWSGEERYDDAEHRMSFVAVDGDLERLDGEWHIVGAPDNTCVLRLTIGFEVGIPALARRINPVAEQVMTTTVQEIAESIASVTRQRVPEGIPTSAVPT